MSDRTTAELERVRMALAEVGVPPRTIDIDPITGFTWTHGAVAFSVYWRAREVAAVAAPLCWACADAWEYPDSTDTCEATHRLMDDCGRAR